MNLLAINPWIVDFAAYDFWLKPYGFLSILTYLKEYGAKITYIDCLDEVATSGTYGRGKHAWQIIPKPETYASIQRKFKRYGISLEAFDAKINGPRPDYILITSSMTYWYPAIVSLCKLLRVKFPDIPIILGGTYASLCNEHAKKTIDCDQVISADNLSHFFDLLNIPFDSEKLNATLPDYHCFYQKLEYAVIRTSWGCPFNCSFCAIQALNPLYQRIDQEIIIDFLKDYSLSLSDFVLYDDAFLYKPNYAKGLLSKLSGLNLDTRFHTPYALHLCFLDQELANLMKVSGFLLECKTAKITI